MEIKKFNPDELEAPLVGGALGRNVVNSQEPDDLTDENDLTEVDDEVNSEDELADDKEDETSDDEIESEEGGDATDDEDELNESDEKDTESVDRYEDVDENAFDKN
jgi:hypothetical protein